MGTLAQIAAEVASARSGVRLLRSCEFDGVEEALETESALVTHVAQPEVQRELAELTAELKQINRRMIGSDLALGAILVPLAVLVALIWLI